jgi:hypothetical protein
VRDKTEDTVSGMPSRLVRTFDLSVRELYLPATLYESAFPATALPLGSSFCARSRFRVTSLRISKWRTIKSWPSNAFLALSLSAALSNEA